ncbi:histidine phosphatase family protein [Paludisphaera mucosa]|uniref:Histidine phosphatase family protein n=1 Tax=Paludisphaera mucosa TaxID=3030827 RepID=A0ABT6F735_9BACT|nr:histidine phosphatase family protein [Paludisphaera mucosa]MDG3003223.1 histidine phosphatase family protein [Paludisphaera mucosa]
MSLIRHAETSAPNIFHGAESDVGLSEWGHKQAGLLADHLASRGAEAVYCSALRRAVASATPIAHALGQSPVVIPELHERKIGPLSGRTRDEGWGVYEESKRRWIAGEVEFSHPGGESFADIDRRVRPILDDLSKRHKGGRFLVVVHGIVIRVALTSLLADRTPADFDAIAIDFASINDLVHDGSRWRAEALNLVVAPSPARPVA